MSINKFQINGGNPLHGTITPQGAKNEALQVICATLLTDDEVVIKNIPEYSVFEDFNEEVEKSHFIRMYDATLKRNNEDAKLTEINALKIQGEKETALREYLLHLFPTRYASTIYITSLKVCSNNVIVNVIFSM